jgi:hypothetical protein
MILTPEVIAILVLNIIFLFFGILAFVLSIRIFIKWDINSTSKLQYTLEKQSFLTATIIKYIFALKLPLFLFFIFTLDKISNVLTGAMCAAGVVDATPYGIYLFILKIINLYLFGFWLSMHYLDIKNENLPYTKQKFKIFIFIFIFFISEIILETIMFSKIDITKMVSCCGTLYSSSATSYISNIFSIDNKILLSVFYGIFLLFIISYKLDKTSKLKHLFSIMNFLFIIVSIISIITFFGTYIYELPTHHCPFCFLQKDYYYVGYFIYTFLFLGTFNGLIVGFINDKTKEHKSYMLSLFFNALFVLLVSYYPISYYLKNQVWL